MLFQQRPHYVGGNEGGWARRAPATRLASYILTEISHQSTLNTFDLPWKMFFY